MSHRCCFQSIDDQRHPGVYVCHYTDCGNILLTRHEREQCSVGGLGPKRAAVRAALAHSRLSPAQRGLCLAREAMDLLDRVELDKSAEADPPFRDGLVWRGWTEERERLRREIAEAEASA